jgi:hypothetical protein
LIAGRQENGEKQTGKGGYPLHGSPIWNKVVANP